MTSFPALEPLFDAFSPTSTDEWDSKIQEDLRGKGGEANLVWDSLEGVTVDPYYRSDDLAALAHVDPEAKTPPLAGSDAAPANAWRTRQDLAVPDLDDAAERAQTALDRGATDLGIVVGRDGDRLRGVPVQRIDDLDRLLASVPLAETPLHWTGGTAAISLYAMAHEVARRRDVPRDRLQGSVHYDPIAALATGDVNDPGRAFDVATELVHAHRETPSVRTLTVRATPYHDAGASVVQELGYTLGALSDLLAHGTGRGLSVEAVTSAVQFVVPVSTSYFLEIAKLRALRLLVPQVIAPFAEAADEAWTVDPNDLFVQAVTSQRTQTIYDPHVNMLRGTTESMAAVVGGCDVLTVAPYDAAFDAPDDFSDRIARNTSLLLHEEAHLDQVADPAAGSYYVEAVTDQLAHKAWDLFQEVEVDGGLLDALRRGDVQSSIAEVRHERVERMENRRRVLVGTNHYPDTEETKRDDVDAAPSGTSVERRTEVDLPTPSVDAIRARLSDGATLGDVVAALRGETPEIEPLPTVRLAAPFETLRLRTERNASGDERPVVTLLPMGHPAWRSARATFSRNVFGVGGFVVREHLRFDTPEDAAQAVVADDAAIAVLCSSDREYPDLTPTLRDALDDAGADPLLVVAGNPEQIEGDVPADDFVHKGSPLHETLQAFQERLGIR